MWKEHNQPIKLPAIQLVSNLRGKQTGKEMFGVVVSNQIFFKQGEKQKRPLGKVNQNKISNSIHTPTATGICSLPFLRMEIQRTPEPARTKTRRKAQTRGGLGKQQNLSSLRKKWFMDEPKPLLFEARVETW